MCSCRLNWTAWCALAGFRSACQWPKLVPTALAWWSSNSACFQKLPLPKVMLWNLHGFEICMIDQWKLWWCYIFLDRVSSNKNETNIHYFPYRSLSRIKHVFWFAGCFWKLKKGQLIYFERFQYLFKLYLNLFASKSNRRNGYGNQKNVWPWNKSNCSWYHNWLISHNYGMHTLKFAMHMILYFFVSQTTLEVELWCYCSQFDFLLHWIESVNQEQEIFQKKTHLVRSLSHHVVPNSTYASSSMLPLHSSCCQGNLCHYDAKNAKIGSSKRQSMSRRPGVAKHLLNVGNPVFRPRCGMSCLLWCTGLQSMPKPWFFRYFFKVRLAQSLSNSMCSTGISWSSSALFHILLPIPHPVEKKLHQCQLQRHRQRNIYNKAIEQNSFVETNHACSKKTFANLELPFETWISFHIILQDNERVRCTTINSWLLRPSRCRAPGFKALQSTLTIIDIYIVIALWVTHTGWGH